MLMKVGYHYDVNDLVVDTLFKSKSDFFDRLSDKQKAVELAIRNLLPNGRTIRADSVYLWASYDVAERLWATDKRDMHLYKMEYDFDQIAHSGDVNHYSDATSSLTGISALDYFVQKYVSREFHNGPFLEVLVPEAKVLARIFHSSEKDAVRARLGMKPLR